jgi:hypothetical protein
MAKLDTGYEPGGLSRKAPYPVKFSCLANDCECRAHRLQLRSPYKWYVALRAAKAKRWDFLLASVTTKANGRFLAVSHLYFHTAKELGECWSMLPIPHARIETARQNGLRATHQARYRGL